MGGLEWIAGTVVNLEEAAAGDEVGGELVAEHAAEETWWMVDSSTVEGAGRTVELGWHSRPLPLLWRWMEPWVMASWQCSWETWGARRAGGWG